MCQALEAMQRTNETQSLCRLGTDILVGETDNKQEIHKKNLEFSSWVFFPHEDKASCIIIIIIIIIIKNYYYITNTKTSEKDGENTKINKFPPSEESFVWIIFQYFRNIINNRHTETI